MNDRMVIIDKNGKIIRSSKNLRGIRDYISEAYKTHSDYPVKIDASHFEDGALLSILFNSGISCHTEFASFEVLTGFTLKNWRNLYGTRISVDGVNKGGLTYKTFE